ncbi:cytidylyltransferase domain-containing protein [Halocola ammonii]
MNSPHILVVIPARGGSKGIPRKNLRILHGKPLIYYSIQNGLRSRFRPDVVVSSEDREILTMAEKFGAQIHQRPEKLADDVTTLDPVIYNAYKETSKKSGKDYQFIITLQPTSPLLKVESLDMAIKRMIDEPSFHTIISATNDTHLTWRKEDGMFLPNFTERVNRQQLTPTYKETGSFLICRSDVISESSRIGESVDLFLLNGAEQIDIDSHEDWNLCEYYLARKKVLFVVSGYPEIGMGHVYNTLMLADELVAHGVTFLVDGKSDLAFNKISQTHYKLFKQEHTDIAEDINKINPDLIINDRLDTTEQYMSSIQKKGRLIVNIEDLGAGADMADMLINAMYPEKHDEEHHQFSGPKYFCLRPEFLYSEPVKNIKKEVKNVLLCFGGVDPNNLTAKTVASIYDYCQQHVIDITVVAGLGYENIDSLGEWTNLTVYRDVAHLSELMASADLIFTSAGRTTFEVASMGIPGIVMAQNSRELTHAFASPENGFCTLGLGAEITEKEILENFRSLVENVKLREEMHQQLLSQDVKSGRKRVVQLIETLLRGEQAHDFAYLSSDISKEKR